MGEEEGTEILLGVREFEELFGQFKPFSKLKKKL